MSLPFPPLRMSFPVHPVEYIIRAIAGARVVTAPAHKDVVAAVAGENVVAAQAREPVVGAIAGEGVVEVGAGEVLNAHEGVDPGPLVFCALARLRLTMTPAVAPI